MTSKIPLKISVNILCYHYLAGVEPEDLDIATDTSQERGKGAVFFAGIAASSTTTAIAIIAFIVFVVIVVVVLAIGGHGEVGVVLGHVILPRSVIITTTISVTVIDSSTDTFT